MTERKIGLDYVRSVAILLVVVCHLFTFYGRFKGSVYPLGYAGVELFFVLSGYLVGGIFLREIVRAQSITLPLVGRFWMRRWLRTVPAYLLFIPVYSWLELRIPWNELPMYLAFSQNLAWPLKGGFGISWSLTIEEWFYLLLPLITLASALVTLRVARTRGAGIRYAFLVTVAVLLIAPLVFRLTLGMQQDLWDKDVRKVVLYRLDAIMIGAVIAYIQQFHASVYERLHTRATCATGFLIAIVAYAYLHWRYVGTGLPDFSPTRLDMVLLFDVMDIGCALMLPRAATFAGKPGLLNAVVLRISLWSYALYLCHRPVMMFLGRGKLPMLDTSLSRLVMPAIAVVLMVAVAAAVYHFFENPIMRLRDRLVPNARRKSSPVPPTTNDGDPSGSPSSH